MKQKTEAAALTAENGAAIAQSKDRLRDGKKDMRSLEEKENIMRYLGNLYQKADMRIKTAVYGKSYGIGSEAFRKDCSYVSEIDNILLSCESESSRILRKQYFQESAKDWYKEFYTRAVFRKYLRIAIIEFFTIAKIV